MSKKTWGKSTLRYDPIQKICWSISKSGKVVKYKDLPTYGVERQEIPQ